MTQVCFGDFEKAFYADFLENNHRQDSFYNGTMPYIYHLGNDVSILASDYLEYDTFITKDGYHIYRQLPDSFDLIIYYELFFESIRAITVIYSYYNSFLKID